MYIIIGNFENNLNLSRNVGILQCVSNEWTSQIETVRLKDDVSGASLSLLQIFNSYCDKL